LEKACQGIEGALRKTGGALPGGDNARRNTDTDRVENGYGPTF
jgi:hypothetical protein